MATENMLLTLPTPLPSASATAGPLYANQNTEAFLKVDSHNHQIRRGALVPSAGIFINADLDFHQLNATGLRSLQFQNLGAPLALADDLNCLYSVAGDMWFNDGNGAQIQITDGASLNTASIGSIGGDYIGSDASVYYTGASKKFFFTSDTNIAGFMDTGALIIRAVGTNANAVTLATPNPLAGSYSLTFPAALPASTKLARLSSTGVITDDLDADNVGLEFNVSNALQVKDLGVTTAKLADASVTAIKVAQNDVTTGSLGADLSFSAQPDAAISTLSCTITTQGGSVTILLIPDTSANLSWMGYDTGSGQQAMWFSLYRDGSLIMNQTALTPLTSPYQTCPAMFEFFDPEPSAGAHTYQVWGRTFNVATRIFHFHYCQLVAYEDIFLS